MPLSVQRSSPSAWTSAQLSISHIPFSRHIVDFSGYLFPSKASGGQSFSEISVTDKRSEHLGMCQVYISETPHCLHSSRPRRLFFFCRSYIGRATKNFADTKTNTGWLTVNDAAVLEGKMEHQYKCPAFEKSRKPRTRCWKPECSVQGTRKLKWPEDWDWSPHVRDQIKAAIPPLSNGQVMIDQDESDRIFHPANFPYAYYEVTYPG